MRSLGLIIILFCSVVASSSANAKRRHPKAHADLVWAHLRLSPQAHLELDFTPKPEPAGMYVGPIFVDGSAALVLQKLPVDFRRHMGDPVGPTVMSADGGAC